MFLPYGKSFVAAIAAAMCLLSGCATTGKPLSWRVVPAMKSNAADVAEAKRLEQTQQWSAARSAYTGLVEKRAKDPELLHRLAVVCTRLDDHAAAAEYYNRALLLKPDDPELLTDAGYGCYLRAEYPAAEELLQLALQADPQHVRAANNLALVLGMQGRMDEAYVVFEQVQPREAALKNLSYIYQQRGEWAEALDCYRLAQQVDPKIQIPQQLLARGETRSPEVAEKAVVTISQASPTTATDRAVAPHLDVPAATVSNDEFTQPFAQPKLVQTTGATAWTPSELGLDFALPAVADQPPASDSLQEVVDLVPADSPIATVDHQQRAELPAEIDQAHSEQVSRPAESPEAWPVVAPAWPARTNPDVSVKTTPQASSPVVEAPQKPGTLLSEEPDYFPESDETEAAADATTDELAAAVIEPPAADVFVPTTPSEPEDWEFEPPVSVPAEQVLTLPTDSHATEALPSLREYCLVALKDQRQLHKSRAEFAVNWQDTQYQFSSQAAAERFLKDPERYLPTAGGLDLVAVRRGWRVVDGSLDHAAWFRDQLFLFASDVHLQQFRAEPQQFVDP